MKRVSFTIAAILLVIAICGCTVLRFQARPTKPVYITDLNQKYEVISHVSKSEEVFFDYTGTVDVTRLLAQEIAMSKADAVVNLNVKVKYSVVDFLIKLVTYGLGRAYTVEVEGDLVQFKS